MSVHKGAHDLKLKKVPLFVMKPVNINVLRSATPQLALVPANRYNSDNGMHMLMSVPSFNRIERGSDGSPLLENQ